MNMDTTIYEIYMYTYACVRYERNQRLKKNYRPKHITNPPEDPYPRIIGYMDLVECYVSLFVCFLVQ